MKRHVVAGIALLGLAGCAHERTAQRSSQGYPVAVGLPPEVPPINQTINAGLPPPDRATLVARAGVGANKGPTRGRALTATGATIDPAASNPPVAESVASAQPATDAAPSADRPTASTSLVPAGPGASAAASADAAQPPASVVDNPVTPAPAAADAAGTEAPASNVATAASSAPVPAEAAATDAPASPIATAGPTAPVPAAAAATEAPASEVATARPTAPAADPSAVPVAASAAMTAEPAPVPTSQPAEAPATATAAAEATAPAPVVGAAPAAETLPAPAPLSAAAPAMAPASEPAPPQTAPVAAVPENAAADPTAPAADARGGSVDPPPASVPPHVSPSDGPIDGAPPASTPVVPSGEAPEQAPPVVAPPPALEAGLPPAAPPGELPPPAGPAGLPGAAPPVEAAPLVPNGSPAPVLEPVEMDGPHVKAVDATRTSDPLLGANPPLMPDMDVPPAAPPPRPNGRKPAAPKPRAADPTPAIEVAPAPAPSAPGAPPDELPPVVLPPAEAPPAGAPGPSLPAPEAARGGAKRDPALVRTAGDSTSVQSRVTLRPDLDDRKVEMASAVAARVGDEVITMTELTAAMKERGKRQLRGQKVTSADMRIFAAITLDDLVERSLVMQEAKRKLKDPKKFKMVIDAADTVFRDHEVPALMRKYHVEDENALREALSNDDSSYDDARENFRTRFITGTYMEQQLGAKMKVDLPEKLAYYNRNISRYERPAQITWREVVVEVGKSASRTDAYRRAEAVFARLRRGEDFAQVAAAESDGPTKQAGGRWQTTPGSYGVPAVNRALETLPIGQVSPIIEGPTSFHIVLVEERRAPGPARFDEVQDEVQEAVYREKSEKLTSDFITKLRSQAYVWTMYSGTPNDPAVLRARYTKQRAGTP